MSEDEIVFWEKRWREAAEGSSLRKRRRTDNIQRWNKMARGFSERTSDKKSGQKRKDVVDWLKKRGALAAGASVLDIGAGPGNWALLLAGTASCVTALEPADAMADILAVKIEEGKNNGNGNGRIEIDRRTWQAVDLEKDRWHKAFDLVFASMTPGIDGPENLRKMMEASKGWCYLSAFSGRGWQQWYGGLWQAVFDEPIQGQPHDIIHPFNLVYAMGYRPELRFNFWEREISMPRERAMEDFRTHIESYAEMTDEIEAKIAGFVDARCEDGTFTQRRDGCQGMMLWNIENKV